MSSTEALDFFVILGIILVYVFIIRPIRKRRREKRLVAVSRRGKMRKKEKNEKPLRRSNAMNT